MKLRDRPSTRLALSVFFAFLSGYISLSYEILWYRAFSFVTWGSPAAFVLLLGMFLVGVALGAQLARRLCRGPDDDRDVYLARLAWLLLLGNAACILVIPVLALAARYDWRPALFLPMFGAGLVGAVLPVIAHFGVDPERRAGYHVSLVYIGNIVGSSLGSALTGFVLMDVWPTRTISVFLGVVGFATAGLATLLVSASGPRKARAPVLTIAGAGAVLLVLMESTLFGRIYERMMYKSAYRSTRPFKHLIENRHGVIAVSDNDRIYGGGAYDGVFNTDLSDNSNLVHRAFAVEALRSSSSQAPPLRNVLMIGLASGSWAQVVAHLPSTASLTVIEINPGYVELIRQYPEVSGLLENGKVTIRFDDARRWLMRHPDEKFDFIVMNTTFAWRSNTTNLTSVEFLEILRAHLRPSGIAYYNTTWSPEVLNTAVRVFPHALRVVNFVAVSDGPFDFDGAAWDRALLETRFDGRPAVEQGTPEGDGLLFRMREFGRSLSRSDAPAEPNRVESRDSILARMHEAGRDRDPLVTDDNMLVEMRNLFAFPGIPVE